MAARYRTLVKILGDCGTSALIYNVDKIVYEDRGTILYAMGGDGHWSTGFGFQESCVVNGDPNLRQPDYETLTFRERLPG